MANGNTLNVELTANADGLKKGLTDADKALKTFENSAESLSKELKLNALASAKLVAQTSDLKAKFQSGAITAEKYQSELADISNQETILANKSKKLSSELCGIVWKKIGLENITVFQQKN